MFYLIIILFIAGYAATAFEQRLAVDKSAVALATGALIWICIALGGDAIHLAAPAVQDYLQTHPDATVMDFITGSALVRHLSSISEVLIFLLAATTVVKIIDSYGGFNLLTKYIKTTNKVKLLWVFSLMTFFVSAVLDNLTTTILMITLMWKLVSGKNLRWIFTGMIVIAANAGGAWSPIGDVTTLMLWTGGRLNEWSMITQLFVPCLLCMLVPLVSLSLNIKGESALPHRTDSDQSAIPATERQRRAIFLTGMIGLMLAPVFKSLTQLPAYIGVLLLLGIIWIMMEMMHRRKQNDFQKRLILGGNIKKTDISNIFFLFGILLSVAGLQTAGHLNMLGVFLSEKINNIYAINLIIGALSSVVNNILLVAVSLGMYDVVPPDALIAVTDPAKATFMKHFVADGSFWELLSYSAATGGSILMVGSTAGIAAMALSKIDLMWYVKKMGWLAFAGYLLGFAAYYLIVR